MNERKEKTIAFIFIEKSKREFAEVCPMCGASNPDDGPKCPSCDKDLGGTSNPNEGNNPGEEVDLSIKRFGKIPEIEI